MGQSVQMGERQSMGQQQREMEGYQREYQQQQQQQQGQQYQQQQIQLPLRELPQVQLHTQVQLHEVSQQLHKHPHHEHQQVQLHENPQPPFLFSPSSQRYLSAHALSPFPITSTTTSAQLTSLTSKAESLHGADVRTLQTSSCQTLPPIASCRR